MKSNLSGKYMPEFRKWMKEYLYLFEKAQDIQYLPYPEQLKLLRNQHPLILDELEKKGMSLFMRDMLDGYMQILLSQCV
ncbi:MAG: hypothetical protein IJ644_06130 [Oscillospiraceae bacterium]|nr:hypothetical protein [Oscillospiraceae bacterium]